MKIFYLKSLTGRLFWGVAAILAAIAIHSCKKDSHQTPDKPLTSGTINADIPALQTIYTKAVGSSSLSMLNSGGRGLNLIRTLDVDWNTYTLQKRKDSSIVAEFDMNNDTGRFDLKQLKAGDTIKYINKTRVVFIRYKNGSRLNFFTKIIEDLTAPGSHSVIQDLHYNNIPLGFNGLIVYYTLDRQYINGFHYTNGVLDGPTSISGQQSQGPAVNSLKTNLEEACTTYDVFQTYCEYGGTVDDPYKYSHGCEDVYEGSFTVCGEPGGGGGGPAGGDSGGGGGSGSNTPPPSPCTPAPSNTTAMESVSNGHLTINVAQPLPGGGSGGTGTPAPCPPATKPVTPPPVTIKVNTDTLGRNFPCAVQLILGKLDASKSYYDFTAPFQTSQKPSLIWTDKDLPWNLNGTGQTELGTTGRDLSGGIGLGSVITLNNKMLQSSSKLIIAAAAIHETLHAYINYDVALAAANGTPNFKFNGSWMNELDFFYDQNTLPSNYRDHYEMMTDYFDQAVGLLATFDNNAHTNQQYAMAMLFGLNTADPNASTTEKNRLTQEYNNLLTAYGITPAMLNTFWAAQLTASAQDKLPTGCPVP